MTPRSIRRAAERKANKIARKAAAAKPTTAPAETAIPTPNPAPVSPAKQAANQANAERSTGPRTEAGKQICSRNALKTGLIGRTVLLPTDDLAAYTALSNKFLGDFNPANSEERALVQSLIDTAWRLDRIVNIEFGIYAIGSLEFADQFDDLDAATRSQMIQVETYLKYEKSIRNLYTQEARLQRRLVKDTAELQRLQTERRQEAEVEAHLAAPLQPRRCPTKSSNRGPIIDVGRVWVRIFNGPSAKSARIRITFSAGKAGPNRKGLGDCRAIRYAGFVDSPQFSQFHYLQVARPWNPDRRGHVLSAVILG